MTDPARTTKLPSPDTSRCATMLESLARDNAALRTKAEALERERDGLISRQRPMDSDIAAIVAEHRSELYDSEQPMKLPYSTLPPLGEPWKKP